MKIYLCGRYGRKSELREYASILAAEGHEITSRWLYEEHLDDDVLTPTELRICAQDDMHDIRLCDLVLVFSEAEDSPYGRGGRHFEHGYATALGKSCLVVGPFENIFHYSLGCQHAADFDSARERLCANMVLA